METIRAIVRPLLTLSGWAVVLFFAFGDADIKTRIVDAVINLAFFWFGMRNSKEK